MEPITLDVIYAGLLSPTLSRWPGPAVTYSVPNATGSFWAPDAYGPGDEPTNAAYGVLDPDQRAAFIDAINAWGRLISVPLSEVPDNGSSQGDIRIAFTNTSDYSDNDPAAYASFPPQPGFVTSPLNGDIWVDDDYRDDPAETGGFFHFTMLHEIGHTLGLKHPFEGAMLPAAYDNTRFTVMSYTDFEDSEMRYFYVKDGKLIAATFYVAPSTPMLFDIIAIQWLYGANSNAATGDDVYSIEEFVPFMATLVDAGGIDTLDLSDHIAPSIIDLTPGAFSSIDYFPIEDQIAVWTTAYADYDPDAIAAYIDDPSTYTWSNNLAISPGTIIENVRGGASADFIQGNQAANNLSGAGGSDAIFGGLGNDTVIGGSAGRDGNYLRGEEGDDSIQGGANFDDAHGNMGNDTVSTGAGDDYCVGGKDNDLLFGDAGADLVYGNLGADTCNGGDGDDIVRGGQDNDTLSGGAGDDFVSGDRGDDTMIGGAGADRFHSFSEAGIDRVLDFSVAEGDRVQLDPGTGYSVLQVGGDTIIQMSAAQVILVGVSMSSLTAASIFGS